MHQQVKIMNVPKKINPDNLKDSIVQILFNSEIHSAIFLGAFNQLFSDNFTFIVTQPKRKEIKLPDNEGILLEPIENGFFLDKSEKIKIDVSSNAIVFNSYKEYVLWDNYYPVIKNTIEKLFSNNMIKEVTRIGIRYISQFQDIDLIDSLNINFSIQGLNNNYESTQIRTEYLENEYKIILTLINKINQLQKEVSLNSKVSIIDIDVIQITKTLNNSKLTLDAIINGHDKQKLIFFSLLKPNFLESLNPEY